jgi:hypothetical protein
MRSLVEKLRRRYHNDKSCCFVRIKESLARTNIDSTAKTTKNKQDNDRHRQLLMYHESRTDKLRDMECITDKVVAETLVESAIRHQLFGEKTPFSCK